MDKSGTCTGYCCRKNTLWNVVLKVFLGAALFMLIFCLGAASVVRMARGRSGRTANLPLMMGGANQGMMMGALDRGWSDDRGMMMYAFDKDEVMQSWQRLFGTITKIENNQITVLDNAAQEQVVLSSQGTIITLASTEVGLSALKVGQNIVVVSATAQDGSLVAKSISVK